MINKLSMISIICIISMISIIFAYSTYGAPSEFGNETTTTCYIGGDDGVVNCTGNAIFSIFKGNLSWPFLYDYPVSCSGGYAVTQIGDSNICTNFVQTSGDDWNIITGSVIDFNSSKLATQFFNASTIQVITGTPQGAITDLQSYNNIPFNVSEVASDIDFRVNFSVGVGGDFNELIVRYKSVEEDLAHTLTVQIYDVGSSTWEGYGTLPGTSHYHLVEFGVFDSDDHVDDLGIVQVRFFQDEGVPPKTHLHNFDWVTISKGFGTPSGEEVDPDSIHKDGDVPWIGNENGNGFNSTNWDWITVNSILLEFGDLISEQNPDGADAIRIKGTDYIDIVIGGMTGLFAVWNVADTIPVFYVNERGDTDITGDATIGGDALVTGNVIADIYFGIFIGSITNFFQEFFIKNINLNGTMSGNGSIDLNGTMTAIHPVQDSFTFIAFPDTQNMADTNPELLLNMSYWITNNTDKFGIELVVSLGDITDDDSVGQWNNVNASINVLDEADMPFIPLPGNHDGANYDVYMPLSRYSGKDYFGGNLDELNNSFYIFEIKNQKYIFFGLNYNPTQTELNFLNTTMNTFNDSLFIINTHSCLELDGTRTTPGNNIWNNLSHQNNWFMTLCGHEHGSQFSTFTNDDGKPVHFILSDYQDEPNGGNGLFRIYTVGMDRSVKGQTCSDSIGECIMGATDDFVLDYSGGGSTTLKDRISYHAERSAPLAQQYWAWGNGQTSQGAVVLVGGELTKLGVECASAGTTLNVSVTKNGAITTCNLIAGSSGNTSYFENCATNFSQGDILGFFTNAVSGSYTQCVASAIVEVPVRISGGGGGGGFQNPATEDLFMKGFDIFGGSGDYFDVGVITGFNGSLVIGNDSSHETGIIGGLHVSGGINVGGTLVITGKTTHSGGVDPPYVLYDMETRGSIVKRSRQEIPKSKAGGMVLFYNFEENRYENFKPLDCTFYVEAIQIFNWDLSFPKFFETYLKEVFVWDDGDVCYNPNSKGGYFYDRGLDEIRYLDLAIYDNYFPENKTINQETGQLEDKQIIIQEEKE